MADRVKVGCINWTAPNAPRAVSYALRNEEAVALVYHDTWEAAMSRANWLARRLAGHA